MAHLLAMVEALREQNEILQDSLNILQLQSIEDGEQEMDILEPQPLSQVIWDNQVLENFKLLSLTSFDGKTDPLEHIISINNQMAIIGPSDSLKCKLVVGTFKDMALRWYMSLPRLVVVIYQELTKKLVQHFSTNKHQKVSTTTLFNV